MGLNSNFSHHQLKVQIPQNRWNNFKNQGTSKSKLWWPLEWRAASTLFHFAFNFSGVKLFRTWAELNMRIKSELPPCDHESLVDLSKTKNKGTQLILQKMITIVMNRKLNSVFTAFKTYKAFLKDFIVDTILKKNKVPFRGVDVRLILSKINRECQ